MLFYHLLCYKRSHTNPVPSYITTDLYLPIHDLVPSHFLRGFVSLNFESQDRRGEEAGGRRIDLTLALVLRVEGWR